MVVYGSRDVVVSGVPLGGMGAGKVEINNKGKMINITIANNWQNPIKTMPGFNKLANILNLVKPSCILYPSKYDAHPDHWAAGIITRKAIAMSGIKAAEYTYLNWEPNPRRSARNLLKYIGWKLPGKHVLIINVIAYKDVKLAAIMKHSSQSIHLSNDYIKRFFEGGSERFYVINDYPDNSLITCCKLNVNGFNKR
jgi:hypothetical protein